MSSYRFVSPGAMARNAIEELFMQQAAEERQRMEDEFRRVQAADQSRRQNDALALQQQQEQRIAAAQQQQMAATDAERQAARLERADAQAMRFMDADATRMARAEQGELDRAAAAERAQQSNELRQQLAILAQGNRPQPEQEWVNRGGQLIPIPKGTAQVGDVPASRQASGRSVLSSDAGRVAELDTSIGDVDVLERDLGTTGVGSAMGAALPNVITEITGLGADSKQRQAVIDRVRQVIGKALEGGVLRKEDEAKYTKILPTIGDPPDVAKAKIAGLRSAIKQRRQNLLESLGDAGFDVSKYGDRTAGDPNARITVVAPSGQRGTIPASQLQDALAQGYKQVQ